MRKEFRTIFLAALLFVLMTGLNAQDKNCYDQLVEYGNERIKESNFLQAAIDFTAATGCPDHFDDVTAQNLAYKCSQCNTFLEWGKKKFTERQYLKAKMSFLDVMNFYPKDSLSNLMIALCDEKLKLKEMILVECDTFMMGNNNSPEASGETPVHPVILRDFYIDRNEVTYGEYMVFCNKTKRPLPPPPPCGWADSLPVVNVTWNDANDYAIWAKKRLPTEAEWEYAARGGKNSMKNIFAGSNNPSQVAWYLDNSNKTVQLVGRKVPNELGIYDMTGNASEWCADYYEADYYSHSPKSNPAGPFKFGSKVIRGGDANTSSENLYITKRFFNIQSYKSPTLGFRCVQDKN